MSSIIAYAKKLFGVVISKVSPSVKEWLQKLLTRVLDFLEKHFNNVVKHMYGIGGAGLGLGLVVSTTNKMVDGGLEKFGFFSRILGIQSLFDGVDSILSPYLTFMNCSFLQAFASFGCVDAINTIINSCAYALLFWLAVIAFKWTIGLIPALLRLLA